MRSASIAAVAAISVSITIGALPAAAAESADAAAHIRQIEHGLLPPVEIEGRPSAPQTLAQLMQAKQVPAVSIAFIDHGRIDWVRSYGLADVAGGRRATPQTLFEAGSISKPVAATAALTLVHDGLLALDEPVNDRLKAWKLPENDFTRKQPVTLRRLLTHTGGVTVHGFLGYEPGKPVPTIIQILDGAPPANSDPIRVDELPGSEWRYSGGGFTIAQLMMTEASGQSFPDLMKARVLGPLGMAASTYRQPLPAADAAQAATGYRAEAKALPGRYNTYPEMAAAGLWTTPTDLARWVIGLQDAAAGRSAKVLDRATAQAMLTPGLGNWGLGVEVLGKPGDMAFTHGGADEGFRAEMYGFGARRQGVVIMTNSDNGEDVMQPLLHAIAASYGWPGFETKRIKPTPVKPGELRPFVGRYAVGTMTLTIRERPDGQSLDLVPPGDSAYELIPQGGDAFVDAAGTGPARFVRDAAGKVTGLEFAGVKAQRTPDP